MMKTNPEHNHVGPRTETGRTVDQKIAHMRDMQRRGPPATHNYTETDRKKPYWSPYNEEQPIRQGMKKGFVKKNPFAVRMWR